MPEGIGYSYQPGRQDTPLQRGETSGGRNTTAPQQAIRTLSLRVPQTQSVPGIAPLPLLNAAGGGGSDLDMLLNALLKAFGPGAMPGAAGLAAPSSVAGGPPRVRPGFEDPQAGGPPQNLADLIPGGRTADLARLSGGNTGFGNTGRGPMPTAADLQPLF